MGKGANYYNAMAQAFDGINRQLGVNIDRADAREARGLTKLLTASQMMTSQENRELAKRSADRSDKQLEETIKANMEATKYRKIADGRDAVRLTQQTEVFNSEAEKRQAYQAVYKQQVTPTKVNIFDQLGGVGPRIQSMIAQYKDEIEEIYGPHTEYDPVSGDIIDTRTGEPLMLSPVENANKYQSSLFSLYYSKADPASVIRGDMTQLTQKITGYEEQLKTMTKKNVPGGMDLLHRDQADLKRQINKARGQLQRRANTSTDELIEMYADRGEKLAHFNRQAAEDGASPASQALRMWDEKKNEAMLDRLYRKKIAEDKITAAATTPSGKVDHRKKMLLTSLEKSRAIYMGAEKNINPFIPNFEVHLKSVKDAAKKQWEVQAETWEKLGYDPNEIGVLDEDITEHTSPPTTDTDAAGDKTISQVPRKSALPTDLPDPKKFKENDIIDDPDTGESFKVINGEWTRE